MENPVEETKYDLSNPNYEESNYSLACPVYEDVVAAVGDYEVVLKNTNRFSAPKDSTEPGFLSLGDGIEQNTIRFLSPEDGQRSSQLSWENSDNSGSSSLKEGTSEITNTSAALEESIKFDDEIYCTFK